MFRLLSLALLLPVLSGCVSVNSRPPVSLNAESTAVLLGISAVVPIGNNAYFISKVAEHERTSVVALKVEALQEVSAQCIRDGRAVEIQDIQETEPTRSGVHAEIEIRVLCIEDTAN